MSWDIFSKSGIQYLLTKLKTIMMDKRDFVELTKAQYDALPDTKLTDGKYYFLTDVNALTGNIDDSVTTSTDTWSSSKISGELQGKNLLDNPWFTVNQRRSTVTQDTFGCDRWGGIYTWNNNIVSLSANNYIIQFFEDNFKVALNGKMITVSIMLANGNVISGSNTYSSSSDVTYINTDMLSCSSFSVIEYALGITAKTAFDVKAVKLELGTVSTLSSDTYPDYAFELAKCQSRKFDNDLYTNQGRILMTKDQKDNGAYNILPNNASTKVVDGITFTVNTDGTVLANRTGTSTGTVTLGIGRLPSEYIGKTVRVVGCPVGGSPTTYEFSDNGGVNRDRGEGVTFTYNNEYFQIAVRQAEPCNNVLFKPMITTDLNATYDDYVPYAPTNRECMTYAANTKLGAHNLLPFNCSSQVVNGITINVNDKGVLTISTGAGGATGTIWFEYFKTTDANSIPTEGGVRYRLSGCPSGGSEEGYKLYVTSGSGTVYATDYGSGAEFTAPSSYTNGVYFNIRIMSGTVLTTPIVVKPMLQLASDTDPTYVPYAKTNRELTEDTSVSFDEYINKGIQIKAEKFGKMARITLLGTTSESVSGIVYTLPDKYAPKNVNAQGLAINGSTGAILGITTVGTDKNIVINATVASGTVVRSTTICYVTV